MTNRNLRGGRPTLAAPPIDVQKAIPLLKHAPEWLIAFSIIAYSTGFLILYTFYRRAFGLVDTGTDFFRPQYVHVALIYLGFFLLILSPVAVWKLHSKYAINVPTAILVFNTLFVFYIFLFSPPGFGIEGENWILITTVLVVTLIGLSGVRWGVANVIRPDCADKVTSWSRWFIVLLVIAIDALLGWRVAGQMSRMFIDGGHIFVWFVFIILFCAWRLWCVYEDESLGQKKGILLAIGLAIMGSFYYMSVLAFAVFVFPYITVSKGGGDFAYASDVKIILPKEGIVLKELQDVQHPEANMSRNMKLVHDTAATLFVADPSDHGDAAQWAKRDGTKPDVIGINKRYVRTVIFIND